LVQERLSLRLVQGWLELSFDYAQDSGQVTIHIFVLSTGITPFEAGLAVPVVGSNFKLNLKLFQAKIYKSRDM
jgi:hypothetical protein